jgi:hypothetical protein
MKRIMQRQMFQYELPFHCVRTRTYTSSSNGCMPCKRVFLSTGAPLENLEAIRLLGLCEKKVAYPGGFFFGGGGARAH